tara:strand:- start:28241 stop:28822 length:582 start_codon:yes stop_codon:yes gene_type:complete
MASEIYDSLSFRRNTPGKRLASIMQAARYEGAIYTFQYTSMGPAYARRKRIGLLRAAGQKVRGRPPKKSAASIKRPNMDKRPLLLLAVKEGNKVWKAKNGKLLVYGFNLNYLEPHTRITTMRELKKMFEDQPGHRFSYQEIEGKLSLPNGRDDSIFRKYDVRGSKLRFLKEVNIDEYITYLENDIEGRTQTVT